MFSLPRPAAVLAALSLFAFAGTALPVHAADRAPPVVRVGPDHYRGKWLEIARRPMWLTDGCVAGYTTYTPGISPDRVMIEDGCRMDTPTGKLKTVHGIGTLKDADSTRAKLRVRYPFFITMDYWVLYTAPDKSWFISADPSKENLWIYTRKVPSRKALARMVAKAASLGYDTSKLEFPAP